MKKTLCLIFSVVLVVLLSGCETVKGIGRDITNTSDAVQKSITGGSTRH